ncbi:MAG: hypothetical protein WC882_01190 [Candidatus Gracilibacteria bacterium]
MSEVGIFEFVGLTPSLQQPAVECLAVSEISAIHPNVRRLIEEVFSRNSDRRDPARKMVEFLDRAEGRPIPETILLNEIGGNIRAFRTRAERLVRDSDQYNELYGVQISKGVLPVHIVGRHPESTYTLTCNQGFIAPENSPPLLMEGEVDQRVQAVIEKDFPSCPRTKNVIKIMELLAINPKRWMGPDDFRTLLEEPGSLHQNLNKLADCYPLINDQARGRGFYIERTFAKKLGTKEKIYWRLIYTEKPASGEAEKATPLSKENKIHFLVAQALEKEGTRFTQTHAGRILDFLGRNINTDITYPQITKALNISEGTLSQALAILSNKYGEKQNGPFKIVRKRIGRERSTHPRTIIRLEILPNEVIPFEPLVFQDRIQKLRAGARSEYGRKMITLLEEVALAYRQVCAEEDVLPMKVRDLAIKLNLSHGLIKKMIEESSERREALGLCVEIIIKGREHILVPRMLRFIGDYRKNALEMEKDEVESSGILRRDKNRIKANLQLASKYRGDIIEKAMNIMRKKSSQHDLLELVKTSAEDFLFTFVVFKFDPDQHPQGDAGFQDYAVKGLVTKLFRDLDHENYHRIREGKIARENSEWGRGTIIPKNGRTKGERSDGGESVPLEMDNPEVLLIREEEGLARERLRVAIRKIMEEEKDEGTRIILTRLSEGVSNVDIHRELIGKNLIQYKGKRLGNAVWARIAAMREKFKERLSVLMET